jgi:cell division protein FtsQ
MSTVLGPSNINMLRLAREAEQRDKSARGRPNDDMPASSWSERLSFGLSFDLQRWVSIAKWAMILAVLAGLVGAIALGVKQVAQLPIEYIRFVGDVRTDDRIDPAELERITREVKGLNGGLGGIGTVDLLALQQSFKRVPWVREATVRRKFPNALEVRLEAHRPLARWGEFDLVNSFGERFTATTTDVLPRLYGPDGSNQEVAAQFTEFQRLARSSGSDVEEVHLNNRRAWQVKLKAGPTIDLGRTDERARLARALALMEFLPQIATAKGIDARYPQGLAVRKD